MDDPEAILRAAETIAGILKRHRIDAVVIGAVALAAYRYVRQTDDIVELLARNPALDLATVRAACARYRLSGIEELIADASRSTPGFTRRHGRTR